jgi:ATP-binding cassette subfamily F protein 3
VEVLSGGERGRLALAKLALTSANLLLLDEPTNHLDIPSQEILQAVLAEYEGTILLVSHDRYLIDALGTQIWEIHPTEVSLTVFEGTYTAYRAQNELQGKSAGAKAVFRAPRPSRRSPNAVKDRRRQQRLAEVESEIQELEVQLQELGRKLETPPADLGEVERLGATYHEVHQSLETLIEEWEQLHD